MHKKEDTLPEALTALANEEKRLHLASNSTIWSHGPAVRIDLAALAPLGIRED